MRTTNTLRAALLAAVALATLCAAIPAKAAFHTFAIAEIFSSADGTVQFVRLQEQFGFAGQDLFSGQTLTCSNGSTTHTFTFPSNLPSSATAGKSVLIGTANLGSLPGGVTPDYVIPADFLFLSGGTVTFAGFVSSVTYQQLPTDGQHSINASLQQQINTPRNFAGMTGSVNVGAPTGSCCVDSNCSVVTQANCSGTWTSGATCASNPCAPPSGVCCRGVTCSITTSANCSGANTQFLSASSSCNDSGNRTTPCCQADFNHAGGISVQDIFDYLNAWFAGSPSADTAGNGASSLVVQNIFDFLAAWFSGC